MLADVVGAEPGGGAPGDARLSQASWTTSVSSCRVSSPIRLPRTSTNWWPSKCGVVKNGVASSWTSASLSDSDGTQNTITSGVALACVRIDGVGARSAEEHERLAAELAGRVAVRPAPDRDMGHAYCLGLTAGSDAERSDLSRQWSQFGYHRVCRRSFRTDGNEDISGSLSDPDEARDSASERSAGHGLEPTARSSPVPRVVTRVRGEVPRCRRSRRPQRLAVRRCRLSCRLRSRGTEAARTSAARAAPPRSSWRHARC